MTKVEEKGRPKYSKFDKLDTAVLEAILRADFDAPEAERLDVEAIIYISNLLAERREPPRKNTETAKAEFYEYYYPMIGDEKSIYDFDDADEDINTKEIAKTTSKTNKASSNIWLNGWRRFASATAIFVLVMFGGTVAAYALGYNPIAVIGRWNDDKFWFEPVSVTMELADMVAEYAGETQLVPKWLPEGYVYDTAKISEPARGSFGAISADFYKQTDDVVDYLYIDYLFPLKDNNSPFYEKDATEVVEYEMYGMTYYIIEDLGIKKIVWRNGSFDCSVSGEFAIDEAKNIINSIYGE